MRLVNRVIETFEDTIVAIGLAVATIATITEVIARYVFGTSTGTGGELTTIFIIWAAMIGAAVAARTGTHIGVDVVVKRMPPRLAKVVVLASLLISALFTAFIAYQGVEMVKFSYGTGQTTMEMVWPRWPLFLSVPVGMALMTYHLLQELVHQAGQPAETFVESVEADAQALTEQHVGA
jgi:C4-dicarboxylate transporter, DctQ subunit